MHEYRDSEIVKIMRGVWDISDVEAHFAYLVSKWLPEGKVLFLGPADSPLPSVLAAEPYRRHVFALVFKIAHMATQNHLRHRMIRKTGQCLARFLQGYYHDLAPLEAGSFACAVVTQRVDFDKVLRYCWKNLAPDGIAIVAQSPDFVLRTSMFEEEERVYLKETAAGYCIETDNSEDAHVVVIKLKRSSKEEGRNDNDKT